MKKIILALAVLALSRGASAFSGNDLLTLLEGRGQSGEIYIAGVMDAAVAMKTVIVTADDQKSPLIINADKFSSAFYGCPPGGVETRQVRDVVLRMLRARPEERHKSAASFVIVAIREAWPCPR